MRKGLWLIMKWVSVTGIFNRLCIERFHKILIWTIIDLPKNQKRQLDQGI